MLRRQDSALHWPVAGQRQPVDGRLQGAALDQDLLFDASHANEEDDVIDFDVIDGGQRCVDEDVDSRLIQTSFEIRTGRRLAP